MGAGALYYRLTMDARELKPYRERWSELMQELGVSNKNTKSTCILTNITKIENGFIAHINIPAGLSFEDWEKHKKAIENHYRATVTIENKQFSNKCDVKIIDKKLEDYMKEIGAKGLAYIKVNEDLTFKSSLDKFLTDEERNNLKSELELSSKDVLFIVSDKKKCEKYAGLLRTKLGEELDLIDKDRFEFCIVNDFPMYEFNEETNSYDFGHNPFSMPQGGLEALKKTPIDQILAYQYDFVCNGCEMASGAVRNHSIEIMKEAFRLAGYDEEVVKNKFKSLYTAFQYGAPPHAGMAPGIDRIIMLLTGEDNLREVQLFPPNVSGQDNLMGGPTEVTEQQLRETHIKIRD